MAGQDADKHEKTEDATPYKLEEARRKGIVAKGVEVNSTLGLVAVLVVVLGMGLEIAGDVLQLCREMLQSAGGARDGMGPLLQAGTGWVQRGLFIVAPLMMLVMMVGVVSSLIQTGPVFSTHPLKPDLNKINPVNGFKKLFSMKALFELFKSLVKLVVLGAILYWTVQNELDRLIELAYLQPQYYLPRLIDIGVALLFKMILALLLVAIVDFLFVRRTFMTSMRMTRRELKDEVKRRDGDPQIKSKRRQLERELRKRAQSVSAVPSADVIITNPTHIAIVLKYDRSSMRAPAVTGKGADKLAQHIRLEAARHQVPVISSPVLARFLYRKVAIDNPVPESTFVVVAQLLRKAYLIKEEIKKRS